VLEFGSKRYGRLNWQNGMDTTRLVDALLRHAFAYASGELVDPESGLSHMAHIRCNAGFIIWYEQQEKNENK
jgi:hypothetical protein